MLCKGIRADDQSQKEANRRRADVYAVWASAAVMDPRVMYYIRKFGNTRSPVVRS